MGDFGNHVREVFQIACLEIDNTRPSEPTDQSLSTFDGAEEALSNCLDVVLAIPGHEMAMVNDMSFSSWNLKTRISLSVNTPSSAHVLTSRCMMAPNDETHISPLPLT